jgi:hypothetical protein
MEEVSTAEIDDERLVSCAILFARFFARLVEIELLNSAVDVTEVLLSSVVISKVTAIV